MVKILWYRILVCVNVLEEMPLFCKITNIIVKDENVVLCGTGVETVSFDEHYQALEIVLKPLQTLKVFNVH